MDGGRGQGAGEFFQVPLWSDKWTVACREGINSAKMSRD